MTGVAILTLGDEVRDALERKAAVVALESAVITHGLPEPRHLEAAEAMADAVRAAGATPALCLVHRGRLCAGASLEDAGAVAANPTREKASARDLGRVIATGADAGLTVSATLSAAHAAGIRVFATGGIGGVHLGAEETGDVSADLLELSRRPVVTVCAGAKSVLDVPRTLEFLETAGVPVVGYRSERFPAFYVRDSGLPVPCLPDAATVARAATAQWALGSTAGMVVGNPIPASAAIDPEQWSGLLTQAMEAAERDGVRGQAVTPYLLAQVARISEGRTVRANVALLVNNARLAAEIALALAP
jgi:pseudouridine-5'-phosphate glycosidase